MKRFILPRWLYLFLSAVTVAVVAGGLWVTVTAERENYRLGRGVDQMLTVVARARTTPLSPNADARAAQNDLLDSLSRRDKQKLANIPGADPSRETARALVSPWGSLLRVFLYPSVRALRLELVVDSAACARILTFYAKDPVALGLKRIDVLASAEMGVWRLVYEERPDAPASTLTNTTILAQCGGMSEKAVSLTFSLD